MTIAAGFVCSDGILLASDTLYSGAGKHGRKFWELGYGNVSVVFGGAGLEVGLRRMRDEIGYDLQPGLARRSVIDIVDAALAKIHSKLPDTLESKTNALVVIRTADEDTRLYENQGTNALSAVDHPSQCVGWGSSLGLYFARSLFRSTMSMEEAKVVAARLVANCKEYSDYCGGGTHLVEIPTLGAAKFITTRKEIKQIELAGKNFTPRVDDTDEFEDR